MWAGEVVRGSTALRPFQAYGRTLIVVLALSVSAVLFQRFGLLCYRFRVFGLTYACGGQIPSAQFVPEAPEDDRTDHICGVLEAVEQGPGPLSKSLLADPTAHPQ